MFKKVTAFFVAALAIIGVSETALAAGTGPDYTALTGAIDTTSTIAAILSVGALMVAVSLAVMGVRKIIAMTRAG